MRLSIAAVVCLSIVGVAAADPASAAIKKYTNIPAEDLGSALQELAHEHDFQVVYLSDGVDKLNTSGAVGDLTVEEALKKLLKGTGLVYRYLDEKTVTVMPAAGAPESSSSRRTQGTSLTDGGGHGGSQEDTQKGGLWDRFRVAQAESSSSPSPGTGEGAQRADEGKRQIEEIVVTAQKKTERLQDVPVPVSVINPDSLAANGQVLLRDYYTSVPAFNVSPNIEGTQTISIRGVTTGGFENPTVGVVIDDVPYGFLNGIFVPDVDPSDIARIEVLRGPQGTIYGADSMGGLLKYVTSEPSTEALAGHIEAGTSDVYNGAELGYNFRGSANIPLSNTVAIRVSGFVREDPGYIDNPTLGIEGINEVRASGGHFAALWAPSEQFSLRLSALYQDTRGYQDEVNTPGTLQQDYVRGAGQYQQTIQAYSAVLKAKLAGLDLTSVTGYTIDRSFGVFDFTPFFASQTQNGIPGTGFNGFGVTGTPLNANQGASGFTQEIRLSASLGQRLDWLLGGFYTHEEAPSYDTITATNASTGQVVGQEWYVSDPTRFVEYAAFADLTYHFTERFDLQVGGRESHIENTALTDVQTGPFDYLFHGEPSPVIIPQGESTANAFTYLVTPRLKLSSDIMAYARFASGYRPGGSNPGTPGAPSEYDPDKTYNYEVGLKGDFLEYALSVDASLYYIDWKNIQLALLTSKGLGYTANGSGAKSEGAELSFTSRPLTGLIVTAWFSYDNAVLTEDLPRNATVHGVQGDRLPNTPRFSGNLSLEQDFPLWSDFTGFAGGTVAYLSDRLGIFTGSPGVPAPRQVFPSYAKTDLRAGIKKDLWTVNLYANNVTDRHSLINGGIGYIEHSAYVYVTPRTIGVNVSRKF